MAGPSPFQEQERAAGAVLTEQYGVALPQHFGDSQAEYEAVRQGVGLVDMSFRSVITLTGKDRVRWLNGQISNDVKDLRPGEGRLAAVLNVKGHILADLAVYALADALWIELHRNRAPMVLEAFDRYIVADDVVVENAGGRYSHLMVAGRDARPFMAEAAGGGCSDLPAWHHAEARLRSRDLPVRIVAAPWLGFPGYEVITASGLAGPTWEALRELGLPWGLHPVGMAALNSLRIEAGWPWYGVDFDDSNLLMEALTADHVSFTKGCYLGQEVVIRIEHQGHLNKRLTGLLVSGEAVPPAKADILAAGRKVGTVTSAVFSPARSRVIALGYVRRECWEPGTKLCIAAAGQSLDAEVVLPPFVPTG